MSSAPNWDSGRIFTFNAERPAILADVIGREVAQKAATEAWAEYALNDAAFREISRLEQQGKEGPALKQWRALYGRISTMSAADKQAELERLFTYYANDIVGSFSPAVYRFATNILPFGFSLLLKPQGGNDSSRLSDRIVVQGETAKLQALAQKGTVLLVPTHASHMDSVTVGMALYMLGLPPFTYGAGKNLFTNPFWKFFLPNLGAYRVDRRITHQIYKDTLKMYSTVLIERGYHSLFFPGGTRARSGEIERRLKLGLLGTGITAYGNNVVAGHPERKVFIVPCTVSYNQVLEAETLIDDHLKRSGQSRYIIERDESGQASRMLRFLRKTLTLDATVYVTFSTPLDPFGNEVDEHGVSHDRRGRPIDTERYLWVNGEPQVVASRDAEYTIECGNQILAAYRRDNVILSTNLVAFALFQSAKQLHRNLDLYQLIRLPDDEGTPLADVENLVDKLRHELNERARNGELRLGNVVSTAPTPRLVDMAMRLFGSYHHPAVATRIGDRIHRTDMRLLYFYQNRMAGYGFERLVQDWQVSQ